MNTLIKHYIQQLQKVQNGKLWIGSTFESKLVKLDEQDMFRRPMTHMHSIAEIISHLTLWRKEAILKIETGTGSKTDDCKENWLSNDRLIPIGWSKLKSEYDQTLIDLLALLETKNDAFLGELYYDTDFKDDYPYEFLLDGMLHHDLYHLGQLGMIIKYL